ncbi:winged helix-turn-helix domain-containing protein [Metallosphaera hakonensis]|uniref:winged helix-turn-helix domain-containing protein n=1 Tax=Metallosphaera hakonensis TaxID=79601 RepID=UPI003570A6FF
MYYPFISGVVWQKKRTAFDIVRDMLSLCENGIKKTNLMSGSRISFELLKKISGNLN